MAAVADLDLPLHRLDERRHHVSELFAQRSGSAEEVTAHAHR